MKRRTICWSVLLITALVILSGCRPGPGDTYVAKPVIYLYPPEETQVNVRLSYDGELTTTYPPYHGEWSVTARPDGTLMNHADGKEYSYLFWEGKEGAASYDFSNGFCVAGGDSMEFLQKVLPELGLIPKEYNEFIVYWLPVLEQNAYNLISFQTEEYTDHAGLEITPSPDSLLRVFMAWKPLEEPIQIEPQTFAPFQREGFTVVEWGGARVSEG